jgi:hypothetical protein
MGELHPHRDRNVSQGAWQTFCFTEFVQHHQRIAESGPPVRSASHAADALGSLGRSLSQQHRLLQGLSDELSPWTFYITARSSQALTFGPRQQTQGSFDRVAAQTRPQELCAVRLVQPPSQS